VSAAIVCDNLTKTYPGRPPVEAVRGINLRIETGECFGLLGPNGAGKTTTVEILEGIMPQTSGNVEILGMNWRDHSMQIRESIGISLQETKFAEKLSVGEILTLFGSFYEAGITTDEAIARVGLQEKKKAWMKTLSGGQKQRLAVASAIIGNPELLFLDEPTTGLDPSSRRQLWDIISSFKKENRTVLLTTHYMEEAEQLCDRVAIIDRGKVIEQGTPRELILRLGGDTMIEFSIAENQNSALVESLSQMDVVSQITFEKEHYLLCGNDADTLLPALTSALQTFNCRLTNLSTRNLGLEDVFVSLTGRSIEDDVEQPEPDDKSSLIENNTANGPAA